MDRLTLRDQIARKTAHRREARQIETHELEASFGHAAVALAHEALTHGLRAYEVATAHDHVGAAQRENARRLGSDAGGRARHDGNLAGEVDPDGGAFGVRVADEQTHPLRHTAR